MLLSLDSHQSIEISKLSLTLILSESFICGEKLCPLSWCSEVTSNIVTFKTVHVCTSSLSNLSLDIVGQETFYMQITYAKLFRVPQGICKEVEAVPACLNQLLMFSLIHCGVPQDPVTRSLASLQKSIFRPVVVASKYQLTKKIIFEIPTRLLSPLS